MPPRDDERAVSLMLDSGAYTAWKKGTPLDIQAYIDWCLERQSLLHTVVNLDVIPSIFGKKASSADVESAAAQSWKNYERMRSAGLKVMPVYHYGERIEWLKRIVDSGAPYVGIGGLVTINTEQRIRWLDNVFSVLCGTKGYPETRIHGFGVTALPVMLRYPWYSVDSTSWVRWGAYGLLFIPQRGVDGQPVYDCNYVRIFLTDRPLNPAADAERFENIGKSARAYVREYYEQRGYTIEQLRTDHYARKKANAQYFSELGQNMAPTRFTTSKVPRGLMEQGTIELRGRSTSINKRVRVFLVFSPADEQSRMLTEIGHRERLVSFLYLKDSNYCVESLIRTGIPEKKTKKRRRVRLEK